MAGVLWFFFVSLSPILSPCFRIKASRDLTGKAESERLNTKNVNLMRYSSEGGSDTKHLTIWDFSFQSGQGDLCLSFLFLSEYNAFKTKSEPIQDRGQSFHTWRFFLTEFGIFHYSYSWVRMPSIDLPTLFEISIPATEEPEISLNPAKQHIFDPISFSPFLSSWDTWMGLAFQ